MRYFLFLIVLNLTFTTQAQKTTIKVLGSHLYTEKFESKGMIILLDNEEHLKFKDTLKSIKFQIELELIRGSINIRSLKRKYRIEVANNEVYEKLLKICNNQKIKIKKSYYKLAKFRFEDGSKKAVFAYANARKRAEIIANHLDYKIVKVLNIDDDTNSSNSFFEGVDKERVEIFLAKFNNRSSLFVTESNKSIVDRGYNLWVTFEVKPNK